MEVDILIVGAGAAGIAASRRIAASGRSYHLAEAGERPGGRAFTRTIAGFPLDLGCFWLHSADRNPWAKLAAETKAAIDRTPPAWREQFADIGFSRAEQKEAMDAFAAFDRRLREYPPPGDRAADALEPGNRWNCYLEALSGFINGAELEQLSVADYLAYEDGDSGVNWRLPGGYGALVAGAADGLEIGFGAEVSTIDRKGPLLVAHTFLGAISARAAIVAVPSSALARERLLFDPPLPEKAEAAAAVPLGLANKAFLQLDRVEPFEPDTQLIGSPRDPETGSYTLRPFGRPLIECFFGGAGARGLEEEGEGAATDFAITQLVGLLGSGMRRRLIPLAETLWGEWAGGSYSHALPRMATARASLAAPVENRIFFAGEACSAVDFSTAHGAYETGLAAAEAALAVLAP
jgi:monoamine oxidase